jgi:ABC-type dipeptide/oligopeptide/nickel transport system ATPase component
MRNMLTGRGASDAAFDGSPVEEGAEALAIDGLRVVYRRGDRRTEAVRGLSLSLRSGRVLGVAGESGSGKSTAALAAMGLLPTGAEVTGSIKLRGRELVGLSDQQLRAFRGREMAMVFQETGTALNPVMRVGDQLMKAAKANSRGTRAELQAQIEGALDEVQLRDHHHVLRSYPDELSGGMCQRVVIAMALSCGSKILALLDCLPTLHGKKVMLPELKQYGEPVTSGSGCRFRHRCPLRAEVCETHPDLMTVNDSYREGSHAARCWRSDVLLAEEDAELRPAQ